MKRTRILWVVVPVAIVLAVVASFAPWQRPSDNGSNLVVLAYAPQPDVTPFYVADKMGYWSDEGLEVRMEEFATGRLSFETVLGGKADLAQVAETPLVNAAIQKRSFVVIATFCSSDRSVRCIARTDRGISKGTDLRGRTVAIFAK